MDSTSLGQALDRGIISTALGRRRLSVSHPDAQERLQRFQINLDEVRPDLRFLTMRANPDHPDHWVVNRLLSEYVPFDFLTRFIVNKEAFYDDYQTFESKFRDYVVQSVTTTYFPEREAFLARMFDK